MVTLTLLLDDDELYQALKIEAEATGRTVQEIALQALRQWQADAEPDDEERAELDDARREWEETGGMEAKAFFDSLRREEAGQDG